MKKIFVIAIGVMLIPMMSFAMSFHSHRNKTRATGPWLFCISEGAELFEIGIDEQMFAYDAVDAKLNIDLRWHLTTPGNYDLTVTPSNKNGIGKEIFFMLQVTRIKNGFLWEMIPINYLIEEDPEYLDSFSNDLEITTGK